MNVPGSGLIHRARQRGNRITVPLTRDFGLADLVREVYVRSGEDHLRAFAASLTFRALFAGFSFLVFLFSLLGIFDATDLVDQMLGRVSLAMPEAVTALIRDQVLELARNRAGAVFRIGALVAVIAALWTVTSGFMDIMDSLNVMYRVKETRPLLRRVRLAVLLSFVVLALILTALVLIIFGSSIGGSVAESLGFGTIFRWTWNILQWPILVFFLLLAFALVYYYAPNVKQEFRFITPGSILGVTLWVGFTLLFLLFVNSLGVYNRVFGALAGLAIHMLYTYYVSYFLLLGAQINQVIEEHAPGGKRPGEKAPGVLAHSAPSES